jgi:hypothetical protein
VMLGRNASQLPFLGVPHNYWQRRPKPISLEV